MEEPLKPMQTQTLWEQLGGTQTMERIVSDFVDRAISDPEVNYTRHGRYVMDGAAVEFTKKSAMEFISTAAGGPLQYSGRSLVEIHRGMQISHREFDAICRDFRVALESHGIDAALQVIVMAKIEGTRALIVSQPS